jgi:hypothetical protein
MISIEGSCCAAITPGQVTLPACALGKHRETLHATRDLYLDYVYHDSISPGHFALLLSNHLQRPACALETFEGKRWKGNISPLVHYFAGLKLEVSW